MTVFRAADGVDLNFVDSGGSGIPLVFQHGLGGDEKQPGEVFPEGARYRRITLECRAHGQSGIGPFEGFSLAQFTDDLAGFIESRFDEPVVVGGISMGAEIALRLAVTRPELVKGLVLARPAWLFQAAPANMAPNALVGRLLETNQGAAALELFEASAIAQQLAIEAPDNLASLRGFFTRSNRPALAALLSNIAADGPDVSEQSVAALNIPALVLGTDRDYVHPFGFAARLASVLPVARLVKVPSKSESRQDYVRLFRQALADFLDQFAG